MVRARLERCFLRQVQQPVDRSGWRAKLFERPLFFGRKQLELIRIRFYRDWLPSGLVSGEGKYGRSGWAGEAYDVEAGLRTVRLALHLQRYCHGACETVSESRLNNREAGLNPRCSAFLRRLASSVFAGPSSPSAWPWAVYCLLVLLREHRKENQRLVNGWSGRRQCYLPVTASPAPPLVVLRPGSTRRRSRY